MHVEAPPPIEDPSLALPPALLPVLRSALAKDPGARFPDAATMAEALKAARAGGVGTAAVGGGARAVDPSRTEVVHTRPLPATAARRRVAGVALVAGLAVAGRGRVPRAAVAGAGARARGAAIAAVPSVPAASLSPLPYTLVTPAPVETPSPLVAEPSAAPVRASPAVASARHRRRSARLHPSRVRRHRLLQSWPLGRRLRRRRLTKHRSRLLRLRPRRRPRSRVGSWSFQAVGQRHRRRASARVHALGASRWRRDPTQSSSRIRNTSRSRDGWRSAPERRRRSSSISPSRASGAE
jgi:hypothetical protein